MKNYAALLLFISMTIMQAQAQILGSFFSQQDKKDKLLTEQIAQLNIYRSLLAGGYDIKDKGLKTAYTFKNQSFGLHDAYFTSLEQVSPAVAGNPKVRQIYDLQESIVSTFNQELDWQRKAQQLSWEEMTYLSRVYTGLLAESQQDLSELTEVITKGRLQLTDAQRLARLDKLYAGMKDKYAFAAHFTAQCRKLAKSRHQSAREKSQVKKLYGIH